VNDAQENKMVIVTDTYEQVNGVSTTYKNLEKVAAKRNLDLRIVHPGLFKWIPMPFYPEIQLSVQPIRLWMTLNKLKPTRVHIATEGAMGYVARTWCKWHKKTFTSSYHTKFPEYLKVIFGVPEKYTYWYMRKFHSAAKATFVTTQSVYDELSARGFKNLVVWTRGVADNLISANVPTLATDKLRVLNVGRVSKEKNLDVLCAYENDFDITIVGDGPYLETLKAKYKKVNFLGYKFGEELADVYAAHDIFAFPSYTDTFGIVMIEAMCNGLPVAGYNVAGPKDVIEHGITGMISDNLYDSIIACKKLNRDNIKQKSKKKWSWDRCFDIFIKHLQS
jgi:glycosyltransferase involved in cell wall biosynthesis